MAIDPWVTNVLCSVNYFLIYLEFFVAEIFTFPPPNFDKANKNSISQHTYFLHSSVFNFTLVVSSRPIYTSLVREAEAAGVSLSDTFTVFSYCGQTFGVSVTRSIPSPGLNCQ